MKKMYIMAAAFMSAAFGLNAQTTIITDIDAEFIGFANVFNTIADGGEFVFGSGWGVSDLQSIIDTEAGTLTLQPNFNTFADNPGDDFWINPDTGEGNKIFEGNTFVEDAALVGEELVFTGGVGSNTLDPSYVAVAFIKVFNADFSVLKEETTPLVAGQNFSVSFTDVAPEDALVQYGFKVTGINANPENEEALGSIVILDALLNADQFDVNSISTYPNPMTTSWNVKSQDVITNISLYNVLGKQVMNVSPNTVNAKLEVSSLNSGIYLATVVTDRGTKTIKLVKM